MYFLLNSNIFDTLISIFLIINAITTIIVSFSEFKKMTSKAIKMIIN